MRVFDVLDSDLDVHKSYLLEASAGTGKTFSIENIVLRLLLEPSPETGSPLSMEEILVVTFTRAATRDLKNRIRQCIDKAQGFFQALIDGMKPCPPAGYLEPYLQSDKRELNRAKQALDFALFCFDTAQIYTIHGFCSKMLRDNILEGGLNINSNPEKSTCSTNTLFAVIKDFFRTGIDNKTFPSSQLKVLQKQYCKGSNKSFEEHLASKLLNTIRKGIDIEAPEGPEVLLERFQQVMKDHQYLTSEGILNDFCILGTGYKEVYTQSGEVNKDVLYEVERFAQLFDLKEWGEMELDVIIEYGIPPLRHLSKPKKKQPELKQPLTCPDLLETLKTHFLPIAEQLSSPDLIFARLSHACQEHVLNFMGEEELFTFDDLLKTLNHALENQEMIDLIQSKYQVAIIDEFQDTDPVQWEIFQQLFLAENKHLYLVGDPKQSIYAFRQADIYTYLKAKDTLGESHHASLNTNYRSRPSLIKALNTLFNREHAPGLISLPRIEQDLPYEPVCYSDKTESCSINDDKGAVHFCTVIDEKGHRLDEATKEYFFPFFAKEIQSLHKEANIAFKEFAILVSDRYQGEDVATYLRQCHIPCVTQRTGHLTDTFAPEAMRELLKAVIYPRNDSALKVALGGPIIGWTHDQICQLEDIALRESILQQLHNLQKLLFEEGMTRFFQSLLRSRWHQTAETVAEKILRRKNGGEMISTLKQVAEILLDYQTIKKASPDALLAYLDEMKTVDSDDNEKMMRQLDPTLDAVNIITGHSSKGLEYSVVFAPGLLKRTNQPEKIFPYFHEGKTTLVAVPNTDDERYIQYCDELDAEKMRQLYVIMTRAKHRLYLPVLQGKTGKPPTRGCASSMELYLARLGRSVATHEELYERIGSYTHDTLIQFLDTHSSKEEISHQLLSKDEPIVASGLDDETIELSAPNKVYVPGAPTYVHSFSGLTAHHMTQIETLIELPPHDYQIDNKTPHTLPAGSSTGNLLHLIFETIDFSSLQGMTSATDLISAITPFITTTLFEGWEEVIATIVWRTLTTPFPNDVVLSNVEGMFKEIEFLYPWVKDFDVEGFDRRDGYLKGVIDLLFIHQGKYYLLDWKSNWLGSCNEEYSEANMVKAMEGHQYYLQAKIYKEALCRYLKLIDNRPFDEIYGGTYYVFLRGVEANGVIYFK